MRTETAGLLLREAREHRGVTQAELAARAGTTQSAISRIEKDRVSPTVETLAELLRLLGENLALGVAGKPQGAIAVAADTKELTGFLRRHRGMAARVAAYAEDLRRIEEGALR